MDEINISELLKWLYGLLKEAKMNLGRAESRPGVSVIELDNLKKKVSYLDYLIDDTIKKL